MHWSTNNPSQLLVIDIENCLFIFFTPKLVDKEWKKNPNKQMVRSLFLSGIEPVIV